MNMPYKRKLGSLSGARAKRARGVSVIAKRKPRFSRRYKPYAKNVPRLIGQVNNLYRMIETKECTRRSGNNIALAHNNVTVVQDGNIAAPLNIFRMQQGAADPMAAGDGQRIGDQVSVKGAVIKGFVENALGRPKVFYRIMMLKGAKGEPFDRATLFKDDSPNKMIDQINTERYTILAQKTFTVSASNTAASGVEVANGAPLTANAGGVGSRTFKMWIPGYKFGRGGNVQFENNSPTQVKFFDYRLVIVVYDWFGTPQDINDVGRINSLYGKLYFKDA